MAKPPVPSVVIRGQKPTAPQRQIVQSMRNIGVGQGSAQRQNAGTSATTPSNFQYPAAPVQLNRRGLVMNPSNTPAALTRNVAPSQAPAKATAVKPHVTVTVHPNGKIELTHGTGSAVTAPASAAPVAAPAPAPQHKPAPHVPVRVPATATGPAATVTPQLTIEQQAQGILDPVKQSILDAINQRTTAQQSAITNYAKDLAGMMGQYGPAAGAAYGNAATGQAAIDAALAQTLQGAGASGQAGLAAKLQQIDADPATAARINGDAAQNTQGALGAAAGRGAASLSQLVGQSANAQDYGAKLPGLAGLYGLQATKSAQSQATTDTANAVSQLEARLPDIIQQLKTNGTQQQQIRFEHGAALLSANGGVVTPEIKALLGGALPVGKTLKAKVAAKNADTAAENADTTATYKKAMEGIADRKLKAQIQKEHTTAKAKGEHLGLSAKDWQQANSLALAGARSAHNGTPDGTHPPISWQQFLTVGLGEKIPIGILIAQGKKVYSQAEIRQGLIPGSK